MEATADLYKSLQAIRNVGVVWFGQSDTYTVRQQMCPEEE